MDEQIKKIKVLTQDRTGGVRAAASPPTLAGGSTAAPAVPPNQRPLIKQGGGIVKDEKQVLANLKQNFMESYELYNPDGAQSFNTASAILRLYPGDDRATNAQLESPLPGQRPLTTKELSTATGTSLLPSPTSTTVKERREAVKNMRTNLNEEIKTCFKRSTLEGRTCVTATAVILTIAFMEYLDPFTRPSTDLVPVDANLRDVIRQEVRAFMMDVQPIITQTVNEK